MVDYLFFDYACFLCLLEFFGEFAGCYWFVVLFFVGVVAGWWWGVFLDLVTFKYFLLFLLFVVAYLLGFRVY